MFYYQIFIGDFMKLADYEFKDVVLSLLVVIGFGVILGVIFQIFNPTLVNVGFLEYFNRTDALPIDLPFTSIIGIIITFVLWIIVLYRRNR